MALPRGEEVVRAVCTEHYDPVTCECATDLYQGKDRSVSRLSVIPLRDQWTTLAATVQKLPGRQLHVLSEMEVGQIEDLGRSHVNKDKPNGVDLCVEEQQRRNNAAHAIIRGKVTEALAEKFLQHHIVHSPPAGFDPTTVDRLE